MIDYDRLLHIWDKQYDLCFSMQDRQIDLDMDKRDSNWWHENRPIKKDGPEQVRVPGRPQYSNMYCAKTGKLVCRLFGLGMATGEDRQFLFEEFAPSQVDPADLIGIGGLWVPPHTELPYHIDVIELRWNWAKTFLLSGLDTEIALYNNEMKVFKFEGVRQFDLHPHYIVHGAITREEPLKLMQFILRKENTKSSLQNDQFKI